MRQICNIGLCLVLVFVISCEFAHASEDSDQETSTVTLVILPSCHLSITDETVSSTLVKDAGSETAFDEGYVELDPDKPTLELSSNKQWKVFAKVTSYTCPYPKNTKDIQLKNLSPVHVVNGFDGYKSLSKSDQEIASFSEGVKDERHPLQYRILLDWKKDIPGVYEATVTYTLSTAGS